MPDTNIIKEYSKERFVLKQYEYMDQMGMKRNMIEVSHLDDTGMRCVYPIGGLPRISNYSTQDIFAGDDTSPYNDYECEQMIDKVINYVNNKNK